MKEDLVKQIPTLLKEGGFKTTRIANEFIKSGINIQIKEDRINVTKYNPKKLTYIYGETYFNFKNFIKDIKNFNI